MPTDNKSPIFWCFSTILFRPLCYSNHTSLYFCSIFDQEAGKLLCYCLPTIIHNVLLLGKFANIWLRTTFNPQLKVLYSLQNLVCWWLEFSLLEVAGFWPICPFLASLSNQYALSIPQYLIACFPVACLLCNTTIALYQMFTILFPTSCEQVGALNSPPPQCSSTVDLWSKPSLSRCQVIPSF